MITLLCVAREESQSDGQTGGHDDSIDTARKMGMATKGEFAVQLRELSRLQHVKGTRDRQRNFSDSSVSLALALARFSVCSLQSHSLSLSALDVC